MPIREYHCKECNGTFEKRFTTNKDADEAVIVCPCGSTVVERVVSRVSRAQFKGRGFYETDYK